MNTNVQKPKNATELIAFINARLPHYQTTGRIRDLRKIQSDPKGKGKSVIIWYGGKSQEIIKVRVTVNLKAHDLTPMFRNSELEAEVEARLKGEYEGCGDAHGVSQEKTEKTKKTVEAVEAVEAV